MMLQQSLRTIRHSIQDGLDHAVEESRFLLRNLGLVSASLTALAMGVVVGRELRQRYKFRRRTPYDIYARAGTRTADARPELEFGVGV